MTYRCVMENADEFRSRRMQFWIFLLAGMAVGAFLSTAVWWFDAAWLQYSVIVTLLCLVVALLIRSSGIEIRRVDPTLAETPLMLARDAELFDLYKATSQSLLRISWRNDPIFRDVALRRLGKISSELAAISEGEVVFEGTETWRIVYEQLLRSRGLYQYRSVSWITTEDYWQDEPGKQSIRLNIELHESGQAAVERIVIIKDELWPLSDPRPSLSICNWIQSQHVHGIWVQLVRESQLAGESDLVADFGIYGSRAVGYQTVDEHGRTVRFVMKFTIDEIERAEERWKRLQVYSTSYVDLLDR